ncbi:MAG: class II fructose-bisphosphate aldolase, partial [Lentisphaeria bacterium]|nr:class II fructose-bisphosphate aldolase [Lentisphaeria bacterium]
MFENVTRMVRQAKEDGYAVPALNTNGATYDITRAALEASQEMQAPVIIQVYHPNTAYRGMPFFVKQVEALAGELGITVPVCLQLDHGKSVEVCAEAMDAGLTSVMIDGSHEPFADNVGMTRETLRLAHPRGVSVEAEIGYVAGNEPKQESQIGRIPVPEKPTVPPGRTELVEAVDFVAQTGVDLLAVSVGTIHGVYQQQTGIDFDLLAQINQAVDVPLVQHGTCGISLEDLSRLASIGMAKINFGEP